MLQHPVLGGNNGGGEFFPQQIDSNIQRNPEVNTNPPKSTPFPPQIPRNNPSTLPMNRGTTHIFYKTRMCQKFLEGNCRNGDGCTFAHGSQDLREPPPNWQELVKDNRGGGGYNWNDDQKMIHQMRICRKYFNGEECPYGDRCNFLHERPAKFNSETVMDLTRTRESSVINIQTMVDRGQPSGGHVFHNNGDAIQINTVNTDYDASRASVKGTYWKTRICTKWETTGQCVFGDKCHFAHGLAELHSAVARMEADGHGHGDPVAVGSIAASSHHHSMTEAPATMDVPVRCEGRGFAKLRLKYGDKLCLVYGDWIDNVEDEQD